MLKKTPESDYVRKKFVFKIIPMLNPDGVIIGNHRTGICGKDLNRQFAEPAETFHPNIVALRNNVEETLFKKKRKIFAYIDFHGHSQKKNVFMYGASYPVYNPLYYRVKILPKLLSKKTEMFRFYSCVFRISPNKMTTSRAIFSGEYGICHFYTLEASYGSYFKENRETEYFNAGRFKLMGAIIVECLRDYKLLLEEEEEIKRYKSTGKQSFSGSPIKGRSNSGLGDPLNKSNGFNLKVQKVTTAELRKTFRSKTPMKGSSGEKHNESDLPKDRRTYMTPKREANGTNENKNDMRSGLQKLIEVSQQR